MNDVKQVSLDHGNVKPALVGDVLHEDIPSSVKFDSGYIVRLKTWAGEEAVLYHGASVRLGGSCNYYWLELKPELKVKCSLRGRRGTS